MRERNRDLADDCKFKLPSWESLKVYGEEVPPVTIQFTTANPQPKPI